MVRRGVNLFAAVLVALVLVMPAMAAKDAGAKSANTITTTMSFVNALTLAGKQIKPGNYHVTAGGTTVTVEQDGKVVAEAPIQWKDEAVKPHYSNVVSSGDQVKEMHFAGKMRYVVIAG